MTTAADYFTKAKASQRQALKMLGHPIPERPRSTDIIDPRHAHCRDIFSVRTMLRTIDHIEWNYECG